MTWTRLAACALVVSASACPSSISPSGAITISTPAPASPANGAFIANNAQPVTLVIKNAFVSEASVGVTYSFEVATEPSFATIVQTKEAGQGVDQTSATLGTLAPGKDYFWRVRTHGGGQVSEPTSALRFTIGPAS